MFPELIPPPEALSVLGLPSTTEYKRTGDYENLPTPFLQLEANAHRGLGTGGGGCRGGWGGGKGGEGGGQRAAERGHLGPWTLWVVCSCVWRLVWLPTGGGGVCAGRGCG